MSEVQFEAIELLTTDEISYSDGKPSAVRKFLVDGTASNLDSGTLHKNIRGAAFPCGFTSPPYCLPYLGEYHPKLIGVTLRSWDIKPLDRAHTFEVDFRYSAGSSDDSGDEGDPGFQEFSISIGRTFVDTWRVMPDMTYPNSSAGQQAENDIEGIAIDSQGEPVSGAVLTQEFNCSVLYTGAQMPSKLQTYRNLANHRNDAVWEGAAKGTLLFPGATVERVGPDLYRAGIVLYWDEFRHARQQPVRDTDGDPVIGDNSSTYFKKAKDVLWRQPYPELGSFSDLGIYL